MNRSKDLRALFRKSLVNKRTAFFNNSSNYISSTYRIPAKYVRIYFYEWSDLSRTPRTFYHLDLFENFLKTHGINIELYQKETIKVLGTVFVTCYTGTRNLSIRNTYKNLMDSLQEHDEKRLIHSPKSSIQETRLPEYDGMFFG